MDPVHFPIDPSLFGLPTRDELMELRIWDSHYHGFLTSSNPIQQHKEMMFYVERMGIERVVSLDAGGTLQNPLKPSPHDDAILDLLARDKDVLSGMTPIDPGYPHESCEKMEKWIGDGPCIGIKYVGGNELGVTCSHPNNDMIVQLAEDMGAVIYIHTWLKVGGEPRRSGGANLPGESSPFDVAELAERFTGVPLICGHSGGDWELGIPAIRPYENIFLEFSGSDPHSGAVDKAVNELGADRIVWGGHGPSRSYSTELSKVLDSSISERDKMKVLGGNFRKIAEGIFKSKGVPMKL